MTMNWKEIALQCENDPKVRKLLKEGPKSLAQAWKLGALMIKYRRFEK